MEATGNRNGTVNGYQKEDDWYTFPTQSKIDRVSFEEQTYAAGHTITACIEKAHINFYIKALGDLTIEPGVTIKADILILDVKGVLTNKGTINPVSVLLLKCDPTSYRGMIIQPSNFQRIETS